ncbi:hypothetical protein [uncultured Algibacter sp.]|uniref:hypothetical protein n=1 Tax=uncultured Algibacter sp. TaxID=298659 RepID=UPI003216B142
MNLVHKATAELIIILEQKRSEFNSYRIDYIANDKDLDSSTSTIATKDNDVTENKEVVFEVIKADKKEALVEEVEVESDDVKVVDLEKRFNNAATDATKTYNERMKSGFFGRRRSR